MKRVIIPIILIVTLQFGAFGQCFDFAKELTKTKLKPYIHDGNYNTTVLTEGQEAEFFKTFYAGQQYRIIVSSDNKLEVPEFEIMDKSRKVLFSNIENRFFLQKTRIPHFYPLWAAYCI